MPNNPITAAVIAETEKVCAEATPAPWKKARMESVCFYYEGDTRVRICGYWIPEAQFAGNGESPALLERDAKFIVHARTWLPIFARTVAEQRQRLEEIAKLAATMHQSAQPSAADIFKGKQIQSLAEANQ